MKKQQPHIIRNRKLKSAYNNKMTFSCVIDNLFSSIAKERNWAKSTSENNLATYKNILCSSLKDHNHKSIDMYKIEDIDDAIQSIVDNGIKNNKVYSDEYLEHLRDLYEFAFSAAAKSNLCSDIFWKVADTDIDSNENQSPQRHKLKLQRSFTYHQEAVIFVTLMEKEPADMAGPLWGLVLMYTFGVRNEESVAICFKDIYSEKGKVPFLLVYKSTDGYNSINKKSSGKSPNADREIPAPQWFLKIYSDRKEKVKSYILTHLETVKERFPDFDQSHLDDFVNSLPVACKEQDFFTPISSRELSDAGRSFFRATGCFSAMEFAYADYYVHSENYDEEEFGYRDPTAYLFRRNFATHLLHCQLSRPERYYVMGHKIEEGLYARNEYITDRRLLILYKKMCQRPLLNSVETTIVHKVDYSHPIYHYSPFPNELFVIDANKGDCIRIEIEGNEPDDKTYITIESDSDKAIVINSDIQALPSPRDISVNFVQDNSHPTEFNNLHNYHKCYLTAYDRYKASIRQEARMEH